MNNGHWASVFLEQEILSVSALGKGSQHHLDLVELKDRSKWVCKKFYPTNWLGKVERAGLELTESVASIVAKQLGITFAAYQYDNQTVFMVGDTKAIIIPYCEGQLLTMLTERQSFVLGSVLAQLHLLKWPSGYGEPFPPISLFDNKDFPKWLTELIRKCNENFYYQADQWVLSHRDIHAANIIWRDTERPHLLDWESTGLIHPAVELIGLAENCAGLAHCNFQADNFRATLMGYGQWARKLPEMDAQLWFLSFHSWLLWYSHCLRQNWLEEANRTFAIIVLIKEKMAEMRNIYADCYSFLAT